MARIDEFNIFFNVLSTSSLLVNVIEGCLVLPIGSSLVLTVPTGDGYTIGVSGRISFSLLVLTSIDRWWLLFEEDGKWDNSAGIYGAGGDVSVLFFHKHNNN